MIAYKRATEAGDAITRAKSTLYGRIGPQEKLSDISKIQLVVSFH